METFTYNIKDLYKLDLKGNKIPINIDPTNFDCNTCDSIFEQVFAFVNQNYIKDGRNNDYKEVDLGDEFDRDDIIVDKVGLDIEFDEVGLDNEFDEVDLDNEFDEVDLDNTLNNDSLTDKISTGLNYVAKRELINKFKKDDAADEDVELDEGLTGKILTGLNDVAKRELINKFKKDNAADADDEPDDSLTDKISTGLNYVAKRELINKFKKDDHAGHADVEVDEGLTDNIFNVLKEKAMNELINQINALSNNDSIEDHERRLDKDKTKLTITINDPNKKNKKTKQQLTVQEIIDNLKKNKVPRDNRSVEYNEKKNKNKKDLIQALTDAETVGQAIQILKNPRYNVNPKYNQYYNEFINTLYGRHPYSGGDNMEDEV